MEPVLPIVIQPVGLGADIGHSYSPCSPDVKEETKLLPVKLKQPESQHNEIKHLILEEDNYAAPSTESSKQVIKWVVEKEKQDYVYNTIDESRPRAQLAEKCEKLPKVKKKKTRKWHHCEVCKGKYRTTAGLKNHSRTHETSKHKATYPCDQCSKVFVSLLKLYIHITNKHEEHTCCRCNYCKAEFNSLDALKKHLKIHLREKPFKCDVCDKSFRLAETLDLHMGSHADVKPHCCSFCHKRFTNLEKMLEHGKDHDSEPSILTSDVSKSQQQHRMEHVEDTNSEVSVKEFSKPKVSVSSKELNKHLKPFVCKECGKQFSQLCNLTRHMRIHIYKCKVCRKQFSQSCDLTQHMRIHTYVCKVCGKSFDSFSELRGHFKLHGPKAFKCEVCGKRFIGSLHLTEHTRVHTGEKPYNCKVCGKRFAYAGSLKAHNIVHTGEIPYLCNHCGKAFFNHAKLMEHIRIHTGEKPYKCNTCGKCFAKSHSLKKHIRLHTGEKPYQCETCGRLFAHESSLKEHIKVHTGEKPYKCKECGKQFPYSVSLKIHNRSHETKGTCFFKSKSNEPKASVRSEAKILKKLWLSNAGKTEQY